jgi:creatinine amidohydrolase
MNIRFDQMRSPEIGELAARGAVAIVPIGACEEHGRHLPVNTDTTIAHRAALDAAERVAGRIPVTVLPPVWFGYSVAMLKNWPGTVTIRPTVLIDVVRDICRSLIDMGFRKILIVNGHGNNPGVLDVAVRSIGDDFRVFPGVANVYDQWDRAWIREHRKSAEGGIGHACEAETSVMLHLDPRLVDMSLADNTDRMTSNLATCPVDGASARKKRMFLSTWFLEDSTHGGAGDPSGAAREFGEALHRMAVDGLAEAIRELSEACDARAARTPRRTDTRF